MFFLSFFLFSLSLLGAQNLFFFWASISFRFLSTFLVKKINFSARLGGYSFEASFPFFPHLFFHLFFPPFFLFLFLGSCSSFLSFFFKCFSLFVFSNISIRV